MSLVITVVRSEPCFNPLVAFQSPEDKQALSLFKRGAVLHLYPGALKAAFWFEHKGIKYPFEENFAVTQALKQLGEQAGTKSFPDATVPYTVDCWVFVSEKLNTLSKKWRRAQSCARDWQNHQGAPAMSAHGLSEKSLATLRYLKRQHASCMYPELFDVWMELNSKGFVAVNANGGVNLRPHAGNVDVPWGSILRLKPVSSAEAIAAMEKPTGEIPAVTLEVANPVCSADPLLRFESGEGKTILDLFKAGAVLHLHRGSTPNKLWLAHADGRKHQFGRDIGTARALVPLSTHIGSQGIVPRTSSLLHNDGGKPMEESWEFNSTKLAIKRLEWASAEECAEDWNSTAGVFTERTDDLSDLAKSTLRTLQQKYTLPMHPELFEVWLELNAKGYLQVFPEGYAQLVPAAREVFVSQGPRLALQYPPAPRNLKR